MLNISLFSFTLSSSGSHVSRVKDRTLEKCTPRLLKITCQQQISIHIRMHVKHQQLLFISAFNADFAFAAIVFMYYAVVIPVGKQLAARHQNILPVNARALNTKGDAKIDAGPTGIRLTTVTAAAVARDGQDLLQGTLSFQRFLLGLPTGVQTPSWCGGFPVQLLTEQGQGKAPERKD